MRFRAETDPTLADHLKESPRNACYTSKGIQNEVIEVVENTIRLDRTNIRYKLIASIRLRCLYTAHLLDITSEVRAAQFYSIIADEVTDASNKEVLSLVLRYMFNDEIKEVIVDFIQVERITGELFCKH